MNLLTILFLALSLSLVEAEGSPEPLNVLYIGKDMFDLSTAVFTSADSIIYWTPLPHLAVVCDDFRPQIMGYNISDPIRVPTPNLDKFIAGASVFTQAYVQQAVCSPSRNSFTTGRRPQHTKIWNFKNRYPLSSPTAIFPVTKSMGTFRVPLPDPMLIMETPFVSSWTHQFQKHKCELDYSTPVVQGKGRISCQR